MNEGLNAPRGVHEWIGEVAAFYRRVAAILAVAFRLGRRPEDAAAWLNDAATAIEQEDVLDQLSKRGAPSKKGGGN